MTIRGWLVYEESDYVKNKKYADCLIAYAKQASMTINVVFKADIKCEIKDNQLVLTQGNKKVIKPHFVINRARCSALAEHLELMGIRVYNNAHLIAIANDKARTHQHATALGIPTLDTMILNKEEEMLEMINSYPVVIKSIDGHGGEEVYKAHNLIEAKRALARIHGDKVIVQELASSDAEDIRVFVVGKQVIGAIRRRGTKDFRSNYSLGGEVESTELTPKMYQVVERLIEYFKPDYVGFDFIIGKEGQFWLNEIEDVVGSRSLYQCTEVDTARCYIDYIKREWG